MTTQFYAPPANFRDGWVELPPEESAHAAKVLRLRAGDEIVVVDGAGLQAKAEVSEVSRQLVRAKVLEQTEGVGEPAYDLTIGLALLKNPKRYDHFLEKAVELGVNQIIPLITERTEKKKLRLDRAESRLIAAMKQCGRSKLPTLNQPTDLNKVFQEITPGLICHEAGDPSNTLFSHLDSQNQAQPLTILIGPEGGFSDKEITSATQSSWTICSLGSRRLRAETAAISVAASIMQLFPEPRPSQITQ